MWFIQKILKQIRFQFSITLQFYFYNQQRLDECSSHKNLYKQNFFSCFHYVSLFLVEFRWCQFTYLDQTSGVSLWNYCYNKSLVHITLFHISWRYSYGRSRMIWHKFSDLDTKNSIICSTPNKIWSISVKMFKGKIIFPIYSLLSFIIVIFSIVEKVDRVKKQYPTLLYVNICWWLLCWHVIWWVVTIWAAVQYIKKGPLATRITTHHLVRISLYYY